MLAFKQLLPVRMVQDLYRCRNLVWQFLLRDIDLRYRGTHFGLLWSFISPLLLLSVYVFVFGFVFKSHFGSIAEETTLDFGLTLFCGLNFFNLFAEVVTRSPSLILQHPNFVKKVVFPLEILPVVATGTAIFHCLIAFVPVAIGLMIVHLRIPWTILYVFLFLLPVSIWTCGFAWLLAATGVFFRDVQNILAPAMTILMFTSAIFYPLSAVPAPWRNLIGVNPMVRFIEGARSAIMWGYPPSWSSYCGLMAVSLVIALIGYFIFDRAKPAFADVI
jgi:lipopolysaccharide transport system permease protein